MMHIKKRKKILKYVTIFLYPEGIILSKKNKSITEGQILHNSTYKEVFKLVSFIELESNSDCQALGGKDKMKIILNNVCKVSVMQDE